MIMYLKGVPWAKKQQRSKGYPGVQHRRVWRWSAWQVQTVGNRGSVRPKSNCLEGGGIPSQGLEGICWSGGGQGDCHGWRGGEIWRKKRSNRPVDQGTTQSWRHLQAVEHSSSGWVGGGWGKASHQLEEEIFSISGLLSLSFTDDAGLQNELNCFVTKAKLFQVVVGTAALVQVVLQGKEYTKEEKTRVAAWSMAEKGLWCNTCINLLL